MNVGKFRFSRYLLRASQKKYSRANQNSGWIQKRRVGGRGLLEGPVGGRGFDLGEQWEQSKRRTSSCYHTHGHFHCVVWLSLSTPSFSAIACLPASAFNTMQVLLKFTCSIRSTLKTAKLLIPVTCNLLLELKNSLSWISSSLVTHLVAAGPVVFVVPDVGTGRSFLNQIKKCTITCSPYSKNISCILKIFFLKYPEPASEIA